MPQHTNQLHNVLEKYGKGEQLTKREIELLQEWRSRSAEHSLTLRLFEDREQLQQALHSLQPVPMKEIWADLEQRVKEDATRECGSIPPIDHSKISYVTIVICTLFAVLFVTWLTKIIWPVFL